MPRQYRLGTAGGESGSHEGEASYDEPLNPATLSPPGPRHLKG